MLVKSFSLDSRSIKLGLLMLAKIQNFFDKQWEPKYSGGLNTEHVQISNGRQSSVFEWRSDFEW